MGTIIEGAGVGGYKMGVDSTGRADTRSVTQSETQLAVRDGRAWNINTGLISVTANTGLIYFEYTGTTGFFLDAIAIGQGNATTTDIGMVYYVKNPTAFSTSTAVDMRENRSHGASQTLSANVYKGVSGSTFTGGTDAAVFAMTDNGRLFATVDFFIPQGKAVGIRIAPNYSSGTLNVYAALIGRVVV